MPVQRLPILFLPLLKRCLCLCQAFLSHKEITLVELSHSNLLAVVIFDDDRDETFCGVKDRIATRLREDNRASTRVSTPVCKRAKIGFIFMKMLYCDSSMDRV